MGIIDRFKRVWNAFVREETTQYKWKDMGAVSSFKPDRVYLSRGNERSIVTSIYNRIAVDVSSLYFCHAKRDKEKGNRFVSEVDSQFNRCLTVEANKDQTARAFIKDIVISLIDEGCIAVVPVDTTSNPDSDDSWDILSMRVGQILEWYPDNVKVRLYNDRTGLKEDITLKKDSVAIIENPFYEIMNAPNSTLQRLIRKLNLLDFIDEQSGSGKLDLIIQLPYVIKTDERRKQADRRRSEIESQLRDSKYGIAYTDGTEHITQLNRPVENNLLKQIEYLTSMLYSQLSIDESILLNTADEKTMLNYQHRTIAPMADAIVEEYTRKFVTKEAYGRGHYVTYFNDPFKLVPVSSLADIADKFTRNEILSSNEVRQIIGMPPVNDPKADELRNKNLNEKSEGSNNATTKQDTDVQEVSKEQIKSEEGGEIQNG